MMKKGVLALLAAGLAAALLPAFILTAGWLQFRRLESRIIETLDQHYLNITTPGREAYLLSEDEIFSVPYMAAKLSADAEPTRIYDRTGRLVGEFVPDARFYARSPDDMPAFLKKAMVAAEDGTFYEHGGINPKGIARAMLVNIKSGRVAQGGSTITQQLAKVLFTTHERTLGRKAFELFCARRIESKLSKDQILLLYANYIYFGHGCYGVECASRLYFGKQTRELDLGESALIAAVIASPGRFSPFRDLEAARSRHLLVLKRMAARGMVPQTAVDRLWKRFWEDMETRLVRPEDSIWRMSVNEAPYFIEAVRRELDDEFPRERLLRGGLRIHTTMDLELQNAAKAAVSQALAAQDAASRPGGPPHPTPSGKVLAEGAMAVVEPKDGGVLALVGGSGFRFRNQLERASGSRRPVGSSIKPFIFAQAFEEGRFKPEDTLIDEIKSYPAGVGKRYAPKNYGGKYHGEVTISTALVKSLNTVAVQVLAALDIDHVIALLSQATGAPKENFPRNLTLALGSGGLTPLELASGYALFLNGGRPVRPHLIARVEDRSGQTLSKFTREPDLEPVLSSATCRTVITILEAVFAPGGTAHAAAAASGFRIPAAGKTGTTDDFRDAWFAGMTPDFAAVLRIGHDDMRVSLGAGRSGGAAAAPAWMSFVKDAYRRRPMREFDFAASE